MEPQQNDRPPSLLAAASLVGLEGLALVVFGVVELTSLNDDRKSLAITTAIFFIALGVGLAYCGRGLVDLQSWARGPVVTGEAIGILVGFSFWGGETTPIAIGLLVVCVLTIVCVLHPATTLALADDYGPSGQD